MPFTDEDGHLIRAFQKEKHDTASQLLNKFGHLIRAFQKEKHDTASQLLNKFANVHKQSS